MAAYFGKSGYGDPSSSSGEAPDFGRLSQAVAKNLQSITTNVNEMEKLVNSLGTARDNEQLRDRLHQLENHTNQITKETHQQLKNLNSLISPSQKIEKNQVDRLVNEFTTVLNRLQAAQRLATQREKESVQRARSNSGLEDGFGLESPKPFSPFKPSAPFQQQQIAMEANVDLEAIREREAAIRRLESDIVDVNTIFKDLGKMVHEQGEMIDSIEANIESASMHVETANTQLTEAKKYQSKARTKKCICVVILLVVLAVIGLIIYFSVPKSS